MKKTYEVYGEILTVGETVEFNNIEDVFRGVLSKGKIATPGLWLDPATNELLIINRSPTKEIRHMMQNLANDPRSRAASTVIDDNISHISSERLSSDEVLRFDADIKDDDMVRVLKEAINLGRLTVRDVSEGVAGGYNLVYGLRKRHSIKYESLLKWCELLRLKPDIRLLPIQRS
jgi:hypothetical protein